MLRFAAIQHRDNGVEAFLYCQLEGAVGDETIDTTREFRHREVSLPPRHFGFRTSGAPSRWGLLRTFTIDGESV